MWHGKKTHRPCLSPSSQPQYQMDECSNSTNVSGTSNILSRIGCILTYGGEANDIVINYTLLVLNSVWCYCLMVVAAVTAAATISPSKRRKYHISCTMALLFVVFFQIGLCLIVGCSGISIIWCAQAGWIVQQRLYYQQNLRWSSEEAPVILRKMEIGTLIVDFMAILYYAIVSEEAITTVAHFCAFLLGSLLSFLVMKRVQLQKDSEEGNTAPQESSTLQPFVPT